MKNVKTGILFVFWGVQGICWSQTKVQIGDLYYNLSGETASVVSNSESGFNESLYKNDEYIIPENVVYNNYSYTVKEISGGAFSSFLFGWGKGSTANKIKISNTVTNIGYSAFANCKNITSMVIPPNIVNMNYGTTDAYIGFEDHNSFFGCDILRTLIYLPQSAPKAWTATSKTYVPDVQSYSSPVYSINDAHVIEMITFDKTEFNYSGQAPSTTWNNNVEGYTASLSLSALNGDVGNHEEWIPVTFTKGDESFTANVVYRYTIKPAKLEAKVENVSREYGEENPQFSISYSGFVSGENESVLTTQPTISTSATKTSNVGDYPMTISGGVATNYEFVYEPGVLTITKAPLSAKVDDATKVYGSSNPSFSIEYYGLKNGETAPAWTTSPSFQTEATKSGGVGEYEVTAINGVPKNYDLGEITPGKLFVTPAPLTIKANNATRQYYNDNPAFSYTCSGFVNGDGNSVLSPEPTLSTSANLVSNVGTYEINVTGAESPNYSISYTNGTLTVTPRTLIASVGNYERPYNEENPTFEVNYNAFVGNDDVNTLDEKPIATTTATKTSNVGTYQIKISGGSAENYQFSYTPGTLTINKAEQTISWNQDLSGLLVGDQVELKAVASSGLPITYTIDNNAAEVYSAGNKTYLDCLSEGQFLIRAVQNGNNNYYSSPRASKTATIIGSSSPSDPTLTIAQADNGTVSMHVTKGKTYTFSIAANDGWTIHSVMFNNSDVTNKLSSDNKYTTPAITGDSWLAVVYEKVDEDAISSPEESNVKILGTSFGARVIDAEMGDMIRVYTTDGKLQHSVRVDNQVIDIPLAKDDIYIIQVGTKTVKLSH